MVLRTDDFDYTLPEELIAQEPPASRGESRLLVVHRGTGLLEHRSFRDLGAYLNPGDVLVANRSRVLPARLRARKPTGGAVELLLLRRLATDLWEALARPSRKIRPGMHLCFDASDLRCTIQEAKGEGRWIVGFDGVASVDLELGRIGSVPLPQYMRRPLEDAERYQTVYADRDGSVAAPTAGLHFTDTLLSDLRSDGVVTEYVTLHVGLGTFRPVRSDQVKDHHMHSEWGEVPPSVAESINSARAAGNRCVAVGTTSVRILESASQSGMLAPFSGDTDIFIVPGYSFRVVDALVTNFHLPRSTLLMLVSAFAGRDLMLHAYQEAIARRYRFFSFGDAMLIV